MFTKLPPEHLQQIKQASKYNKQANLKSTRE